MDLVTYLNLKNISQRKFAKLVDVDHTTISKYCKGTRLPKENVYKRIVEATKGVVKMRWRDDANNING